MSAYPFTVAGMMAKDARIAELEAANAVCRRDIEAMMMSCDKLEAERDRLRERLKELGNPDMVADQDAVTNNPLLFVQGYETACRDYAAACRVSVGEALAYRSEDHGPGKKP